LSSMGTMADTCMADSFMPFAGCLGYKRRCSCPGGFNPVICTLI